ncbi:V-type proton ATPase subunit G 1 [Ceratitis capitata]|uniref:V-type proton ATPase subunit G n=1 Tax=Ceratitis capitata TaxID=7213 RepID=W8BY05_CERCA|nr:V-type proton ATPase subunit G 1 [Ceratitis capitata]
MKANQTPLPQLIQAEKQAADIIFEARKRKRLLLNRAKNVAVKEVETYHGEREVILNALNESVQESIGITQRRVEQATKEKIAKIDAQVETNREAVVKMILKLMNDFVPEVHRNYLFLKDQKQK